MVTKFKDIDLQLNIRNSLPYMEQIIFFDIDVHIRAHLVGNKHVSNRQHTLVVIAHQINLNVW